MNLKHKILLFLFAAVCMPFAFSSAQPSVRAFSNERGIVIGDQLKIWLEVKPGSPADRITWPALADSVTGGLEIVEKGPVDTIRSKDTFLLRQRLLVTGFDSGSYYFPAQKFQIASGGQQYELFTDSLPVAVQTVAVDTTRAFKPIKEIVAVPFSIWDYWVQILCGILLLGLLVFTWIYFYKNRKTKAPAGSKVPPEKPHEKALRMLEELRSKDWIAQGLSKTYFSALSDIVRVYLEERFGIPAMEQTTDELLALLKKQNDARSELRRLRPQLKLILRTADLVKFAKANPLPDEHRDCLDAAMLIVTQTRIKEEEAGI